MRGLIIQELSDINPVKSSPTVVSGFTEKFSNLKNIFESLEKLSKDETGCASWDENFLSEFPMPVVYDAKKDDPNFSFDDHPYISFELAPQTLTRAMGGVKTAFVHYNVKVSYSL